MITGKRAIEGKSQASVIYAILDSERHTIFFFQAEDGIRDDLVTGVQTLLFRSSRALAPGTNGPLIERQRFPVVRQRSNPLVLGIHGVPLAKVDKQYAGGTHAEPEPLSLFQQIGRASCRERVSREVGGVD